MARREYRVSINCREPNCRETYRPVADTRAEERRIYQNNRDWKCTRHRNPESLITPSNRLFVKTATAYCPEGLDSLSWSGLGTGYVNGPGFHGYASDVPEGTKVVVVTSVVLPKADMPAQRRIVAADLLRDNGFDDEATLLERLGGREEQSDG